MDENKLQRYQGFLGQMHDWRDNLKERVSNLTARHRVNFFYKDIGNIDERFSHLFRYFSNLFQLWQKSLTKKGSYFIEKV